MRVRTLNSGTAAEGEGYGGGFGSGAGLGADELGLGGIRDAFADRHRSRDRGAGVN